MAKITYIGVETASDGFVRWRDRAFRPNVALDVEDAELIAAAKANPAFFAVSGDAKPEEPEGDERDEDLGDYKAVHKGRGVYDVTKDGAVVKSGLSKAEAEDWVKARSV